MESFVTLPWSTNGVVMAKTRRMCDWCGGGGWGGWRELVELVQRLLVVHGNQSNHSLTPAPSTQPNFKWRQMRSHRFQGKRGDFEKTKQSWQSWLFGVAAAIWEPAVAGGQFENISKGFQKHLPCGWNFSLSISRLPLDKVGYRVIVRLFSVSQFPSTPCNIIVETFSSRIRIIISPDIVQIYLNLWHLKMHEPRCWRPIWLIDCYISTN